MGCSWHGTRAPPRLVRRRRRSTRWRSPHSRSSSLRLGTAGICRGRSATCWPISRSGSAWATRWRCGPLPTRPLRRRSPSCRSRRRHHGGERRGWPSSSISMPVRRRSGRRIRAVRASPTRGRVWPGSGSGGPPSRCRSIGSMWPKRSTGPIVWPPTAWPMRSPSRPSSPCRSPPRCSAKRHPRLGSPTRRCRLAGGTHSVSVMPRCRSRPTVTSCSPRSGVDRPR